MFVQLYYLYYLFEIHLLYLYFSNPDKLRSALGTQPPTITFFLKLLDFISEFKKVACEGDFTVQLFIIVKSLDSKDDTISYPNGESIPAMYSESLAL